MSCGACGKEIAPYESVLAKYTKGQDGLFRLDDIVTADAMCAACPHAGLVICTVSGNAARAHSKARDCPIGRHPIKGVVKWWGLRWYGTPYPIRWYLWAKGKVTSPSKLPGCGCVKVMKDLTESARLRSWLTRLHRSIAPSAQRPQYQAPHPRTPSPPLPSR